MLENISRSSRLGARCARTSRLPLRRNAAIEDNVDLSVLPTVNATLNGLATLLLIVGRLLIRKKRVDAHRRVMIGAFSVSTLFLGLYVLHKASRGFESLTYNAGGALKIAYLTILFTHLVLAMTVPVLAIILVRLGLTNQIERHRRLARIAWPIWMYVSVTGVAIYAMLYHFNPVAS
jgi:uncharacterized membrane protein YozB (DUF420 family)